MARNILDLNLQPFMWSGLELIRSHMAISMVIAHEGLSDLFDAKTPMDCSEINANVFLAQWANHNQCIHTLWKSFLLRR